MSRARVVLPWLAAYGLAALPAQALQQPAPADSAARSAAVIARAETMARALAQQQRLPGLSLAVGRAGRILWTAGFGWADLERKAAVTPETRFRTGSVAKPLTALAAALLHARGTLDLDRPIRTYLPGFPDKGAPITSRQLAGHLAGIRHYGDGRPLSQKRYGTATESLELFQQDTLLHSPGSRYAYSSYGYVLLSAVIEAVARRPYPEVMRQLVFDPLGMTSTAVELGPEVQPNRAAFYVRRDGRFALAPAKDFSYVWAAGGILTTPSDLVRFGMAVVSGRLLDPRTADLLFTRQTTLGGDTVPYAFGWRVERDAGRRRVAHHGGQTDGARAFLLVYPDEGLALAAMANVEDASFLLGEATTIAELFLDSPARPDSAALERRRGMYRFTTEIEQKPVTGFLHLSAGTEDGAGWISEFYSRNPPIVRHTEEAGATRLTAATSWGLVNLWVRFTETGFEGRWGWQAPRWEIRAERVK